MRHLCGRSGFFNTGLTGAIGGFPAGWFSGFNSGLFNSGIGNSFMFSLSKLAIRPS
ncbi:hypothetical protein [Mycobacterium paragordonae]|uniref:Uncharacterized protein n=1 Tax=Mycobacterium paragordonae TaxID=1389713 RepID=A0AAJ1S9B7_9MYCO|nr:hypothetical protein [Mycobacterium paragordonae]MDP7737892.1 hypothetical protein [Mycobacterium paragordonae]